MKRLVIIFALSLAHIIILAVEVNRPFLRITAPMEQPLSVEANDFLTLFFL